LRIRRSATDAILTAGRPGGFAVDVGAIFFNEKQVKEAAMRMGKLQKRRIDALKAGHLQDDELDEALITDAIKNIEKDRVAQRDAAAEKRRKLQIVCKVDFELTGKTVYLQSHRRAPDSMEQVNHPLADFIICDTPGAPPPVLRFAACLHGSSICTQEFFQETGGVCVTYVRAIAVKRHIHITDAFMVEEPTLAELFLAEAVSSQWTLASVADLISIVRGQPARQRLALVFVGAGEADSPDLRGLENKFTAASCFDRPLFCKFDKAKCRIGACSL